MARVRVTREMALDAGAPEMEGAVISWGSSEANCDHHCRLCIHSSYCAEATDEDDKEAEHGNSA